MMRKKQESRDPKTGQLPVAWHSDFRSLDLLPHMGIARIVFMLKVVVIVLPVLFGIGWGYLEIEAFVARSKNGALRAEIADRSERNEITLEQSASYDFAAEKVQVVQHFYEVPLVPLSFLVEFAQKRPPGLVLKNLSVADMGEEFAGEPVESSVIHLQGYISDTSVSALEMMDSLKEILTGFESLKGRVGEIDVVSVRRDVISKLFTYSMTIQVGEPQD